MCQLCFVNETRLLKSSNGKQCELLDINSAYNQILVASDIAINCHPLV